VHPRAMALSQRRVLIGEKGICLLLCMIAYFASFCHSVFVSPPSPQTLLRHAKVPAFLVTNLVNIRYLTGTDVSAGAVLVTPRRLLFFVDPRYREVAANSASSCTVCDLRDLKRMLARIPLCGCEAESVTLAQKQRWKSQFRPTKFLPKSGVLEYFRRSKNSKELKLFRTAQKITQEILRRVPAALRGPVSERELAWKLHAWARELRADQQMAFDPIVAFGMHTSRPHHHPTTRTLKKGDIVQVDTGARVGGYCADQSRVFFTGTKTPAEERALAAVEEAKHAAERLVRTGASTHELDRAARAVLQKHGMEDAFAHSLGHGVGLEIHEGVTLSQLRPEEHLLSQEIVTIEPGVYFPGKFGIRLEDEVVVSGD